MGLWGRGLTIFVAALALAGVAHAQTGDERTRTTTFSLPAISVTGEPNIGPSIGTISGVTGGTSIGITGASTTVITREEIERAPEQSLVDIISREAGVQSTNLQGGVNNAGNTGTIDMRGFGITAPSNTLVLVDGRRYNDADLTGFDFSLIPRNAIERIEIVRGNSGGVVYGDGAVGGVINIVTKNGVGQAPNARVEAGFGSLGTGEIKASASGSNGPFSAALVANIFSTDGYRDNSATKQQNAVGDFRYRVQDGSVFLNLGGSHVDQRLPGPRNVTDFANDYVNNRRGTYSPFDNAHWDNLTARAGVTRNLGAGVEAILDGSFRQKQTTFQTFLPHPFLPLDNPQSFNTTTLDAYSVTPRINVDQMWTANIRARMIAGVDVYYTDYESLRRQFQGAAPNHVYNFEQTTTAAYAQPTWTFWNTTDVSVGGRIQYNSYSFRDKYDPLAPTTFPVPQGLPLDTNETRHAYHLGFEHRFAPALALFGRYAQSFRVPNIDERVGMVPIGAVTNFNLRTQRSHDVEGGVKFNAGVFTFISSVYQMNVVDELHFNPITFANVNLPPTRRTGWENTAYWRVADNFRIKSTLTHIDATFRAGPFAGKDVPEVAKWSGSTTVSWDIYGPKLTADFVARYFSDRWLDGDEANVGRMKVPAFALFDLRVGGTEGQFFWAITAQNIFDRKIFDYGLDQSGPGFTFINLYPLPGRTVMLKVGATLP